MKLKIISIIVILLMVIGSYSAVGTKLNNDAAEDCGCDTLNVISNFDDNTDYRCGLIIDNNIPERNPVMPNTMDDNLPESYRCFDVKYIPIENQGDCGSCWAFATTGVFECLLKQRDDIIKDLSEQYLISCNKDGWGCEEGGGFGAHKYHYDKKGANGNGPGAVLESTYPYQAKKTPCKSSTSHPYKLEGWGYIYPRFNDVADTTSIKKAIIEHGPVSCGIYAGPNFKNYKSGILRSSDPENDDTLHAVILYGWNDNNGDGYWYLRNSWGKKWGETWYGEPTQTNGGYMRIKYGCSKVGYWANYIKYKDPVESVWTLGDLEFGTVPADSEVTGTFEIANSGEPKSFLNWEIDEDSIPDWGSNWDFEPGDYGTGVGRSDLQEIEVIFRTPHETRKTFTGQLIVRNSEDLDDYDTVDISLTTSRSRYARNSFVTYLIEKIPILFRLLQSNFQLFF
jgi:C1A family cysteine protease